MGPVTPVGMDDHARSERRAHTRLPVELWVEETHGRAVYYQRATDLSLGGLFLSRTLPHPPGTRVELRVDLGGADPLRVRGEVVDDGGRRAEGMGLRFVSLDRDQRARLADFLLRCASH